MARASEFQSLGQTFERTRLVLALGGIPRVLKVHACGIWHLLSIPREVASLIGEEMHSICPGFVNSHLVMMLQLETGHGKSRSTLLLSELKSKGLNTVYLKKWFMTAPL